MPNAAFPINSSYIVGIETYFFIAIIYISHKRVYSLLVI